MKTYLKVIYLAKAILLIGTQSVFSQTLTQVVRGKIYDNESLMPIPDAYIVVVGTNPLLGSVSDAKGNFVIPGVPVGRYNIQISDLGYEPVLIPEVLITTGKEVEINVGLKQLFNKMKEVTIRGYTRKDKPVNTMAGISARSFTVEETRRYAGGLDDPARLVSAFAGVTVGNVQDNAIIIRGNSPKGVSWRLEGIEIPNPNHFPGGNVAGGGAVTVLSSQMLSNSDFFTSAFPAEYGNALAGIFDMKLRNGNNEKREYIVQAGMLGVDLSAEGPFRKGKEASYLFNYRYSTSGLLSNLGFIPSDQVPKYQDLSFKLNFPTPKAGSFSIWGIGASDNIMEPDEQDSTKWQTNWDRIHYVWNIGMGALGISHKLILDRQTYLNTIIAASGTRNKMDATRFDNELVRRPNWYFIDNSVKATVSSFLNHRFGNFLTMRTGVNFHELFYNLNLNGTLKDVPETFKNFVDEKGMSSYTEFYVQSKYDLRSYLSVNTGIYTSYFALNRDFSFEPRVSLKWELSDDKSLSFGFGKHSQLEELKIYLINHEKNGKIYYPDKNLKLSRAQHFVIGYDWLVNENVRAKVEPYFQYLYDVPGIPDSSYSMINFKQDWTFRDSLTNCTKGRNIGIDFTLERFLHNNFYYLFTASIFTSTYKAADGVWRNTRYNKGFSVNLLAGKEFFIKRNRV